MQYKDDISAEERFHYIKQSFDDLNFILSSTRPVGQQFFEGQPVWNKRMISEQAVLKELNNNSLFSTARTYLERGMRHLLTWFTQICEMCERIVWMG